MLPVESLTISVTVARSFWPYASVPANTFVITASTLQPDLEITWSSVELFPLNLPFSFRLYLTISLRDEWWAFHNFLQLTSKYRYGEVNFPSRIIRGRGLDTRADLGVGFLPHQNIRHSAPKA
jgi:hypothetical protein